jgi:hypothetical protein
MMPLPEWEKACRKVKAIRMRIRGSQFVPEQPNDFMRRSVAREYLQRRILGTLQDQGVFAGWAFIGGTALRFLFGLPRYSKDLDFSSVVPKEREGFPPLMQKISGVFADEGYENDVRIKDKGP